MSKRICPYLGLIDQPATAHVFPSEKNVCYKAAPPAFIQNSHQRSHCLSTNHETCPVFVREVAAALPPALMVSEPAKKTGSNWLSWAGVVTGLVIFVVGFIVFRNVTGGTRALPAAGPERIVAATMVSTVTNTATETVTATRLVIATLTPLASPFVPLSCAPPASWLPYTVRSGESLASLSQRYAISADTIRSANCIPAGADLRPGERIFLPGPTATLPPTRTSIPSATTTWTPTMVRTFIFPTATNTTGAPPPPPTTAPQPSNTAPPPTSTPVPTPVPTEGPPPAPTGV